MRLACSGLSSWFDKQAAVVTPSRLLASVAGQQFTRYQLRREVESWHRPSIASLDAWLSACWQEARYSASDVPALLSPSQERLVWQDIIEQEQPDLFDVASTARLASGAFRLLSDWQIPAGGDVWNDHQDAQHFLRWQSRFRQKCQDEHWITRADLLQLLPVWIEEEWCERQLTVFAAFDVIPPALEQIRLRMGRAGAVEPIAERVRSRSVAVQHCSGFPEELEQAARCARAALESHPDESIGVLVPDLAAHRSLVERVFEQAFYPAAALRFVRAPRPQHSQFSTSRAFHVNAASPLSEHPIVANALLLLELARPRLAMTDACAILRSSFIVGAEAERSARALADLALRRRRDIDLSLRDMEYCTGNCPRLQSVWQALREKASRAAAYRDLPAWGEFIRDLLETVGWPGDAQLSPEELDIVELWKNAVSTFASLGLVTPPVSYETALARLCSALSESSSERGDWSSPVQIIDASAASAIQVDTALLVGLSDETWPPAVRPSALVPLKVQRAYGVPGSSRQSVYEIHQKMTASLFAAAPALNATFSGRLSPLAAQFVQHKPAALVEWQGKLPIESFVPTALDEVDDSYGPPFESGEPIRGGTGIVKSQSLCPFRAFAEYRLHSNVPEEACFGFDSRDRGQFLHRALQSVWNSLKTQDRLRATQSEQLHALVRDAVLEAVRDDASSPFHELTTNAERERLEKLILQWLEIERSRSQPFTVETVEQERFYEIPGLRLRLRVDRIDRLKDGSVLLIDYKSGKQTSTKLEGERPAEPQLLVYAAAVGEPVDGVFFGQLKPRDLRAVGFSRERHFRDRTAKIEKGWDDFIDKSIANVEKIAFGFVKGEAVVDPIRGACDYCSQKPFCRIQEKSTLAGEGEVDSE